jgi:TPR repeat protein
MASLWLASLRDGNYAKGLTLMSQAASTGFAQAQYELAVSLSLGLALLTLLDVPAMPMRS